MKHSMMEQVEGNATLMGNDLVEDDKFADTCHYWKTSKHSSMQIRLLTTAIFQKNLKVLEVRKSAFGENNKNIGIRSSDLLPLAGFHPDQASSVWKWFFQHNIIFPT